MQIITTTTGAGGYVPEGQKAAILSALRSFVAKRPGFEPCNYYGAPAAYRADSRKATEDRHDAEALIRYIELRGSISGEDLALALSSGRLIWDGKELEYTTGQYWCVEYRAAVCRALTTVVWSQFLGDCADGHEGVMRAAKRNFSRRIVRKWFR